MWMYSPKLSVGLKQIKGGKTLKQGDNATELIYIFVDEDGSPINLGGGSVNVSLLNEETNTRVYTKSVTSDGNSVKLTINKALPTATYDIEMTLNGHKVPSNRYESQLIITANHDNALVDEIEVYGIDKLKQEIIQSISGGTINLDGFLKAVDANKLYAPVNHSHSEYALSSALANYALKDHTHNQYADKTHTHTEYAPIDHTHDNYVTQEQLAEASLGGEVDLSGYVSKTELADKSYLTAIPDEYVTETELSNKGYLTAETFTQTQADKLYQSKGNYATKEELANVSSGGSVDLSNYLTKNTADSTYQPKGNYLTVIPSEYVTEAELQQQLEGTTSLTISKDKPDTLMWVDTSPIILPLADGSELPQPTDPEPTDPVANVAFDSSKTNVDFVISQNLNPMYLDIFELTLKPGASYVLRTDFPGDIWLSSSSFISGSKAVSGVTPKITTTNGNVSVFARPPKDREGGNVNQYNSAQLEDKTYTFTIEEVQ